MNAAVQATAWACVFAQAGCCSIWLLLLLAKLMGAMRAGQPTGDTRKRFTAVALDGQFRISAVAPLLNKLIQMRNDTGATDMGIGIVSMLGFSATSKALQVRRLQKAFHVQHPSRSINLD